MSKAEEYRQSAAECVRMAQHATNEADKLSLLQMAEIWRELANRLEEEDDGQNPPDR